MAYESTLGLIALTRFGYGPRGDGDVKAAAGDPRGFLTSELAEPGIALLSGPGLPSTETAIQRFFDDQDMRRQQRAQAAEMVPAPAKPPAEMAAAPPATSQGTAMLSADMSPNMASNMASNSAPKPATPKKPPTPEQLVFRAEALARIRRAVQARAGVAERLVAFWSNHFCVSATKGGIGRITAGAFEREAIRPHVLGRFSDMLLAVESHPAMLHYLDNAQSVGPGSRAGLRGKRGLNENLGREIMELHTLGVGAGYTQADVTNLARIITGWTYAGRRGGLGTPGSFVFNTATHEPGAIDLLGTTYPETGVAQGRAALLDLARKPQTARFISGKLAAAFVADTPPLALVERLARVFRDTDGDLRALAIALFNSDEAWTPRPARMRTPYEFLIATNRLLGHVPEDPGQVLGPLATMGMSLWAPPGPNGFPLHAAAWASPEGMKLRLDYSAAVAGKLREPPDPRELLDALCGDAPSPQTREAVARAEDRRQGLALLLMSPEMQRS